MEDKANLRPHRHSTVSTKNSTLDVMSLETETLLFVSILIPKLVAVANIHVPACRCRKNQIAPEKDQHVSGSPA